MVNTSRLENIGDVLQNASYEIAELNTTNIIQESINNDPTGGWVSYILVAVITFSALLIFLKNKEKFGIYSSSKLVLYTLVVTIDFVCLLYVSDIIRDLQLVVFLVTVFFCLSYFSLMDKQSKSADT